MVNLVKNHIKKVQKYERYCSLVFSFLLISGTLFNENLSLQFF